jgi:hypothetical protein
MTRRNDKRNNRRNRQRNNQPELSPFAQMLFGAILSKGAEMIANKMMEKNENTPSIHAEGITDKDIQNINEGNASLSKLYIPNDGTAVEYPTPENLEFFFDEEGKLMVRKKHAQNDHPQNEETQEKPITYDDVLKELYLGKTAYWVYDKSIESGKQSSYNFEDAVNCTSVAQAKRMVAFNKLQNIAKYLNGDWKPDFDGNHENWSITKTGDDFLAMYTRNVNKANVYFKSRDLTFEAIRLMGEYSLNDLFSTDW